MELPINRFKQGLASGNTQYGLWLGIPDNTAAEISATAGFDWLLIDQEHAAFDLNSILRHLQVLAAYSVAPVVRPAHGDVTLLKKLLDIGAQSLLVPMVEDAQQAEQLASVVRYPPTGSRGIGTSMARAARWNQVPGYLQHANDEICLIVQVESGPAMANLDDILQVEGIDGVFIGPSDLSASMGHIGNPGHPEVVAVIEDGIQRIAQAGRYAGILCSDKDKVAHYERLGASFIGLGADTTLLADAARQLATGFKGK